MCGIFCICSNSIFGDEHLLKIHQHCETNLKRRGPDFSSIKFLRHINYNFVFAGSVLWLQGNDIVNQPIETDKSVFVYNGDVFGGDAIPDEQRKLYGDTMLFLKQLESPDNVQVTLSNVHGPYSFVYLDKAESKLYFGRDVYGRRSLLISKSEESLLLTSVASKTLGMKCIELPAIGTFCYDLQSRALCLIPWQYKNENFRIKLDELEELIKADINIVEHLPIIQSKSFTEPCLNDLKIFEQIKRLSLDDALNKLLDDSNWVKNVKHLNFLLEKAIETRIATQPKYCHLCISQKEVCNHALTGVLFSGGVDCTILALLADKFCEAERPIDLLNVAFDKVKNYTTPDRLTGIDSYEELKLLRPNRQWNFVEINVTQVDLDLERSRHICHLIYPLNSILDDSLGCALWFASRGGSLHYTSPCRVLLVGMGADELFGGYTRHRAALTKKGWHELHNVLNADWQNISHRNLARDDRVVSDHGRQLRTPYLDENVVEFVRNLNSWEKTYPSNELSQGLGEKILLRSLAYYLGLKNAAGFKKRALQFGSRIANKKENAHDISPRL